MGRPTHHGPELSFSACNVKLEKAAAKLNVHPSAYWSLDLRAGVTCPYARDCKSQVVNGAIVDGPHCKYRCYAASQECRLPVVFNLRERNTIALKRLCRRTTPKKVADCLDRNAPAKMDVLRIHTSGDMFNWTYFAGLMEFAKRRPLTRFYFYTKALPLIDRYVQTHPDGVCLKRGILTPNVRVTASFGGTHDYLIELLQIRSVHVIMDENETELPIDDDDTHAALSGGSFALMIHGTQPKGSCAAKVWDKIRRTKGSYAQGVGSV